MSDRRPRVLITKAGVDGHERGARVIARVLADAGMEVVFQGFHPRGMSPRAIVSSAIQEDVDLIGISFLVPIYMEFTSEVIRLLKEEEREDIGVILGGLILEEDKARLLEMGVKGIFTSGIALDAIVKDVKKLVS